MKTIKTILLSLVASSLIGAEIVDFKYNPTTKKATITTDYLPTNTTWKVQYADSLNGTNTIWKEYANILNGGRTNKVDVYSPVDGRFFRLRQR